MKKRFVVGEEGRLDVAIAEHTTLSRKRAKSLVGRGAVKIDGQKVSRSSHKVSKGEVVEVHTVPTGSSGGDLPERYRDEWVVVVDKPSGMPSQPTRHGHRGHVLAIARSRDSNAALLHRLDTPASGLLILGLSHRANRVLTDGFREGHIHRIYLAAVVGEPPDTGTWDTPLDNKPARTRFERLNTHEGISLLEVQLVTGRTHQIRRHAAEAGHPILGDRRHGGAAGRAWSRLALHAFRLVLEHPVTGAPLHIESPVPDDLSELFAPLRIWTGRDATPSDVA
jgi:23S rRNA pseudouridine1911/1915/1917 synthase